MKASNTVHDDDVLLVVAQDEMDDETFVKHYNARHQGDIGTTPFSYSPHVTYYGAMRAWHRRCHNSDWYDHNHEPDPHVD